MEHSREEQHNLSCLSKGPLRESSLISAIQLPELNQAEIATLSLIASFQGENKKAVIADLERKAWSFRTVGIYTGGC